jgi:hypothetical protein
VRPVNSCSNLFGLETFELYYVFCFEKLIKLKLGLIFMYSYTHIHVERWNETVILFCLSVQAYNIKLYAITALVSTSIFKMCNILPLYPLA